MKLRSGIVSGLVLLFLCIGPLPVFSQAFDMGFDLNTPVSGLFPRGLPAQPDLKAGAAFHLGFFSKSAFANDPSHRFGFVVGRKQVTDRANSSVDWAGPYTALRVQGRADMNIWRGRSINLRGGAALGLEFMSDSASCNEPLCNLPESVVLISPNMRASIRISSKVSGIVEFRGTVYLTDNQSVYPFAPGVSLSFGLEFSSGTQGWARAES